MTPNEPRRGNSGRDDARQLWSAMDTGWIMVVELLTATFTWGGIGWLLDRWLETAPWLLSFGFIVGWGTGIYLVWMRHNAQMEQVSERSAALAPSRSTAGASTVPRPDATEGRRRATQ